MKRLRWFILGIIFAAILLLIYSRLDESQKRFVKHLAKQVPYMPARYFA